MAFLCYSLLLPVGTVNSVQTLKGGVVGDAAVHEALLPRARYGALPSLSANHPLATNAARPKAFARQGALPSLAAFYNTLMYYHANPPCTILRMTLLHPNLNLPQTYPNANANPTLTLTLTAGAGRSGMNGAFGEAPATRQGAVADNRPAWGRGRQLGDN
jgi:hypothetical protein